ncbi:MAG: concanavalin A-like lectin/glucanase domain-containing protein [Benjaminiella poitrasii]|nr:MAG: concanavalin A-like lectin/glucanase domain-containing protein [Benjaminiella poitrasii]
MRVKTSPLAFNRHPKETSPDRPAARVVSDDRLQFWPQTSPEPDLDLTVQGTHPLLALSEYIPGSSRLSQHYFEMTVEQVGSDQLVLAIGLCTTPYPVFRMPGWNKFSVAYHSDDGHKFCDDATGGQPFGPGWTTGDTVGCGYCPETGNVFFTLNGCRVGPHNAFSALKRHYYYPSFGADGPAQVQLNFGQRPFLYPVENWIGNHV